MKAVAEDNQQDEMHVYSGVYINEMTDVIIMAPQAQPN